VTLLRCFCERCNGEVTFTDADEFLAQHPGQHQFAVIEHTQIRRNRPVMKTEQLQLFNWNEQDEPL
jgi:hypothetical protein